MTDRDTHCFRTTITRLDGTGTPTLWCCDRERVHDDAHHGVQRDGSELFWPREDVAFTVGLTEEAKAALAAVRAQVDEKQALFDLQWTRTREADQMWQRAHPEAVSHDVETGEPIPVWPDLGELVGWLMRGVMLVREWRDASLNDDLARLADLTGDSTEYLGDGA